MNMSCCVRSIPVNLVSYQSLSLNTCSKNLEDAVNYIWLFVVSGGAALLGFALAFGMISQDPKRSIGAIAGSFIVAILALGAGIYVSQASTAPIQPPDRNHTEEKLPAGPAHTEELPGEPKSQ